jgi:SAM-dependent methyltransferase
VTTDLNLSPEDFERLYSADYFHGAEYHDYVGEQALIERHFESRLKMLLRHVPDAETKTVFEIGCAYGFFLNVARTYFRSVRGIDISRDAVAHAAGTLGLPATVGDYLDLDISAPVDVVCLWDTIEHLQSPHRYIEHAAAHLRPEGVLALTTGDIGSAVARWRGTRWRQIHPPTHLHYFSRATLTGLLERHGFTVEAARYDGMYRSLDTIAYIVFTIKRRQPWAYAWLKRTGLLRLNLYLNLFDIIYVVARKPAERSVPALELR